MNAKSIKYIRNYIIGSVILVFIYISILEGLNLYELVNILLKVFFVPIILALLLDPLLFLFKTKILNRKLENPFSQGWKDNFIESVVAYWIIWNGIMFLLFLIRFF
jgi:hypothetical protein